MTYRREIKMINIVEEKIQEVLLEILEKNYESADIRCGFYGDMNSYYLNNNITINVSIEQYTYSLDDCTYKFLEEKIKEIIDPVQESCVLFQKFLESLPEHIDIPLMSLINRDKDVKRLCIYFSDCEVSNGNITILIGCTIR